MKNIKNRHTSNKSGESVDRPGTHIKILYKFILFTLLLFVVMTVVATYFFSNTKARELGNIIDKEAVELERYSILLEQRLSSYVSDISLIESMLPVQDIIRSSRSEVLFDDVEDYSPEVWIERLEQVFSSFIEADDYYLQLRYIDKFGMEIVRVDKKEDGPEIILSGELQDKSDRYYFQEVSQLKAGDTYISPIDLNVEKGLIAFPYQAVMRYSRGIYDSQGEFVGMVILNVEINEILDLVKTSFAEDPHKHFEKMVLLDQDGYFMVNIEEPKKEFGRHLKTEHASTYYREHRDLITSALATHNVILNNEADSDPDGAGLYIHKMIDYNPIDNDHFLVLINSFSEEDIFGAVKENWKKEILTFIAIFLGVFLAGYLFIVHPMVRRIILNAESVKRVVAGDLSEKITVTGNDEIADVGDGIKEMLRTLKKRKNKDIDYQMSLKIQAEIQEEINTKLENSQKATINLLEDLDEEKKVIEEKISERTFELEKEKEKLDVVADQMVTGTILLDSHGQVLFLNGSLLKFLDIATYEATTVMEVFFKKFKNPEIKSFIINAALTRQSDDLPEIDVDGRVYGVSVRSIGQKTPDAEHLASTIIFVRDITDEKMLERSKSELVAVASHQLRTPLTAMRGSVELLVDESYGKLSGGQKELLDDMETSTIRLITMVNDMLDITKIEDKTLELHPEDLSPITVVDSILLDFDEYIRKHEFTVIHNKIAEDITIFVDALRARQVLQNLIDNSIKYSSHPGTLTISYELCDESVTIVLEDDGIGIPEAEHNKLFGRFYRASNTAHSTSSGSGLGLYIVKSIAESLNGSISFTSKENEGTTFRLTLPRFIQED